jgi:hypothetical protein
MHIAHRQSVTIPIDAGCVSDQASSLKEAIAASRFGGGGEATGLMTVAPQWRRWVAVRDACRLGRSYRYSDDQIVFHYAHSGPQWLRALVARMASSILTSSSTSTSSLPIPTTSSPAVDTSTTVTVSSSATTSATATTATTTATVTVETKSTIAHHDNDPNGDRRSRGSAGRNQLPFDMHLLADQPQYVQQAAAMVSISFISSSQSTPRLIYDRRVHSCLKNGQMHSKI